MGDERVWLRHSETGGVFHCPTEAVDEWVRLGWEPGDPPEPENPVVAENLAWRAQQEEQRAAAEREAAAAKRKSARAAKKTDAADSSDEDKTETADSGEQSEELT